MKKVFEGNLIYHCGSVIVDDSILDLLLQDFSGNRVRITVEELPESKPEEKNCGNCAYMGKNTNPCEDCVLTGRIRIKWHPKPAEPQGWEQRLKTQFPDAYGEGPLMAFIRAEIERAREEEKQAIAAFLRGHWLMTDGIAPMASDIEQNKHREGGE